jgi:hypothetical protein
LTAQLLSKSEILQRLVIDRVSAKAPVTTANVTTLTELHVYSRSLASPLGLAAWSRTQKSPAPVLRPVSIFTLKKTRLT